MLSAQLKETPQAMVRVHDAFLPIEQGG